MASPMPPNLPPTLPPILPMVSRFCAALTGATNVPGDKSISHRALILASQALGTTEISGLLEGEDVLNTAHALRLLGVNIEYGGGGRGWKVSGVGPGGLREATDLLDMGNSGTGARLLMGLVTPYDFVTFFTGDDSLRKRPMQRVMTPLQHMGARFEARSGDRLPIALLGTDNALPISYTMPVASAQVKSAILLAALNTPGATTVIEPSATRDHTERMLRHFGWQVDSARLGDKTVVTLKGQQEPAPQDRTLNIPGDPSSAAFLMVAALLLPGSDITLKHICVNPLRTGLLDTLREMGADIECSNPRIDAGEEVADIRVRHSKLKAVTVPAERAPSMIDEYPVLAIAAAFAEGETVMRGLSELKVKESDRLAAIAEGLTACGIEARVQHDDLTVKGAFKPRGGATVKTHYDHRIAMSFLVMGMASLEPVGIDDGRAIATSFPGFAQIFNGLGARIAIDTYTRPQAPKQLFAIAVDGPASSGKGTLARRLAEHFNLPYLDTGSIYRAVGLKLIYSQKSPYDKRAAIDAALSLSEQDLSNPRLRQERIGQAASIISAIPEVRSILLDFQREFACNPTGAVLDGRDIGTVVCPDAAIKIFITATLETRAKRRHRELQGEGIEVVYGSVYEDLRERDERDAQRAVAPLVPACDAIIIDTSNLDAKDVFLQVVDIVNRRLANMQPLGVR